MGKKQFDLLFVTYHKKACHSSSTVIIINFWLKSIPYNTKENLLKSLLFNIFQNKTALSPKLERLQNKIASAFCFR